MIQQKQQTIWLSETIVDVFDCTSSISHSIPPLELCSRNIFDIYIL